MHVHGILSAYKSALVTGAIYIVRPIMQALVVLFAFALSFASSAHDLSDIYPFKTTLNTEADGGLYELFWNFDHDTETISFAVRVQTTGWVGLGISPNGQMPNSDVIIGWVTDDGENVFHVRLHDIASLLMHLLLLLHDCRIALLAQEALLR